MNLARNKTLNTTMKNSSTWPYFQSMIRRTKRYDFAVALCLVLLAISTIVALMTHESYTSEQVFPLLAWFTLPLILSSLVLSIRGALLIGTLTLVGILFLPLFISQLSFPIMAGPLAYLTTVFLLAIFAAIIRGKYLNQINQHIEALRRVRDELQQSNNAQIGQTIQLRQLNERMSAILQNNSDGIILAGIDGAIDQANLAFDKMFNYEVDEMFGKKLNTLFEPGCAVYLIQAEEDVVRTKHPVRTEVIARRKDGSTFNADVALSAIANSKGEAWKIICSIRDITERKRVEELLRRNEQRYRSLFDQTHDAVFILDLEGHHIVANKKASDMLGYAPEELNNLSYRQIVAPSDLAESFNVLEMLHSRQTIPLYERLFRKKNGDVFPVEITVELVCDTNDEPMHIQSVVRDISERKRAEAAVRDALEKEKEVGELKTRFVSMASHEFRTPLATIQATSDSLRYYISKMSEEQINGRFDKIQTQVKHMTLLLDDVLILGKLQAGKLDFNPDEVDLARFCHEIVEELQSIHQETHQLIYSCSQESISAYVDPKLIRQIVTNLLTNGIKYSPAGKSVSLALYTQDQDIVFQVTDSGIGIPQEDQARLFEAFHRAQNVGNIAGTGLGLAITKQAVDLHQGHISFKSQTGVGTTFTIVIPRFQDKG